MPRRSRRRQRKKNYKQNFCKKIKSDLEKQNSNSKNVNARLNDPVPEASEFRDLCQYKPLRLELESDLDPDVFFEFHPDDDVNRSKSDSALEKLNKYIASLSSFDVSSSNSDVEKTDPQLSIDSCRNTLTDSVSTSRTVDSFDVNRLKSHSMNQMEISCYRDTPLSVDVVKELQKDEMHLKEMKLMTHMNGGVPLMVYPGEITNAKMEKSYENLNQQMIMKLNDEALELGITTILPKRLNSSSNILGSNFTGVGCCGKKSLTGMETLPDICNKHYSRTFLEDVEEASNEEDKMYLETKKNEKHLLNCSLLGEEPQSRSTPIIKPVKSKEKWKSPTEVSFVKYSDSSLHNSSDEYHTCFKEILNKNDSLDEDESLSCLSQYVSCRDVANKSKEVLKIFPFETETPEDRMSPKISLRDVSIQCEILKVETDEDEGEVEEGLDVSMTVPNFTARDNFETFKKLFTKISVQRFLHVLSILPMDKILEFFCLTFSIPLIETMAISISVTKVMNVLSTGTILPDLNGRLKHYSAKTLECLKSSWGSFLHFLARKQESDIGGSPRESCPCLCDVQKMTDLEKRLKNLENELTKFQFVDAEIEKLKEIAKALQEGSAHIGPRAGATAPPLPPPPPPPPPPLPPPPPAQTPTLIKPNKTVKPQDSVSRPSITVEDLQKVILRKVTTREKQAPDAKKGPLVSLEMLRSVKLRSSAKKRTPTCSPTRTPTSRERIRRIKSPFRSASRSRDRKSRYPNIPLSEILNMDDSYQLFEPKTSEGHKTDSAVLY